MMHDRGWSVHTVLHRSAPSRDGQPRPSDHPTTAPSHTIDISWHRTARSVGRRHRGSATGSDWFGESQSLSGSPWTPHAVSSVLCTRLHLALATVRPTIDTVTATPLAREIWRARHEKGRKCLASRERECREPTRVSDSA